jgi:hypothetical protein
LILITTHLKITPVYQRIGVCFGRKILNLLI